ncbi:MAG TPA: hypothetical protein VN857_03905 [Chthoniobacterales bacterium]|jgi:hypothetical protein|nr:hypothetical protein [Chthoniobacterales bacterium]
MFVVTTTRLAVRAPFDRRSGGLCVGIVAGFPGLSRQKKDIVVGCGDLFPAVSDREISFPVEID